MPRPDGRLYPSEIDAALGRKRRKPAKVKRSAKTSAIPAAVETVVEPAKPLPVPEALEKIVEAIEVKNKGGRPKGSGLKATPELIEEILGHVRTGLSMDKACLIAGISSATLDNWKAANKSIHDKFTKEWNLREQRLLGYVEKAAARDHKAASWLLERQHGVVAPVTRSDGPAVNVNLSFGREIMGKVAGSQAPVRELKQVGAA